VSFREESQIAPSPTGSGVQDYERCFLLSYVPTRRYFTAPRTTVRGGQPFGHASVITATIPGRTQVSKGEKQEVKATSRRRPGLWRGDEGNRRIYQPGGISGQLMTNQKADGSRSRSDFSSREREVMELLVQGCSTAEIGRQLFIAKSTVRSHIAAIVQKLPAKDRASAVALLRANGGDKQ
jgi:DNA-binding NarL/FixJ family response regulator